MPANLERLDELTHSIEQLKKKLGNAKGKDRDRISKELDVAKDRRDIGVLLDKLSSSNNLEAVADLITKSSKNQKMLDKISISKFILQVDDKIELSKTIRKIQQRHSSSSSLVTDLIDNNSLVDALEDYPDAVKSFVEALPVKELGEFALNARKIRESLCKQTGLEENELSTLIRTMEGEELKNVVLSILEQQQQFFDYNKEQDPELTTLKKEEYYAKRELDDLEYKIHEVNYNLQEVIESKVVHEKELEKSQKRLDTAAKEFEEAKEEKEALKAKIFTKEDPEYKTAKANYDQAKTNVKLSEKKLDASKQKVLQRESEVKECKHQLSRLEKKKAELSASLQAESMDNVQSKDAERLLKQKEEKLAKVIEVGKKQKNNQSDLKKTSEYLKQRQSKLEDFNKDNADKIRRLEGEASSKEQMHKMSSVTLKDAKKRLAKLEEDYKKVSEEKARMKKEGKNNGPEYEKIRKAKSEKQKELEKTKLEYEDSVKSYEINKENFEEVDKALLELKETQARYQKKQETAQEEYDKALKEQEEYQAEASSLGVGAKVDESLVKKLQKEVEQAKQSFESKKEWQDRSSDKVTQLQEELVSLEKRQGEFQKSLEQAQESQTRAEQEYEIEKTYAKQKRVELSDAKSKYEKLEEKLFDKDHPDYKAASEHKQHSESKYKEAQKALEKSQKELETIEEKQIELEKKLSKLESKEEQNQELKDAKAKYELAKKNVSDKQAHLKTNKKQQDSASAEKLQASVIKIALGPDTIKLVKNLPPDVLVNIATNAPKIVATLEQKQVITKEFKSEDMKELISSSAKEVQSLLVSVLEKEQDFVTKSMTKSPAELAGDPEYKKQVSRIATSKEMVDLVKSLPDEKLIEFATKSPVISKALEEATGMKASAIGEMFGSSSKETKSLLVSVLEKEQDFVTKSVTKSPAELAGDPEYKKQVSRIATSKEMVDLVKSLPDEKLIEFATKSPVISKALEEATGMEASAIGEMFGSSSKETTSLLVSILEKEQDFVTKSVTKSPAELAGDPEYKKQVSRIATSKEMVDLVKSLPDEKLIEFATKSPVISKALEEATGMKASAIGEMFGSSSKETTSLLVSVLEKEQDFVTKSITKSPAELAGDPEYKKQVSRIATSEKMVDLVKSLPDEKLIEFATKSPVISKALEDKIGFSGSELFPILNAFKEDAKKVVLEALSDKDLCSKLLDGSASDKELINVVSGSGILTSDKIEKLGEEIEKNAELIAKMVNKTSKKLNDPESNKTEFDSFKKRVVERLKAGVTAGSVKAVAEKLKNKDNAEQLIAAAQDLSEGKISKFQFIKKCVTTLGIIDTAKIAKDAYDKGKKELDKIAQKLDPSTKSELKKIGATMTQEGLHEISTSQGNLRPDATPLRASNKSSGVAKG